jgi:hypothetical protein
MIIMNRCRYKIKRSFAYLKISLLYQNFCGNTDCIHMHIKPT